LYDKREILIPLAGIVLFVGAVVLMIWGDELGVLSLIRQVPPLSSWRYSSVCWSLQ